VVQGANFYHQGSPGWPGEKGNPDTSLERVSFIRKLKKKPLNLVKVFTRNRIQAIPYNQ
jgi:hypothetical protein